MTDEALVGGCGARAKGAREGRCGRAVVGFLTVTRVRQGTMRLPRCEQHATPGGLGWSWAPWIDGATVQRISESHWDVGRRLWLR